MRIRAFYLSTLKNSDNSFIFTRVNNLARNSPLILFLVIHTYPTLPYSDSLFSRCLRQLSIALY
ncbi:MAG: hypothetical protein ACI8YQ_000766 [Polaribacter sp.]|jgi:hypothetical protein